MISQQEQSIASTLALGLVGAGLVYFGRRANPGILSTVASTVGFGLLTRAISTTVVAVLSPSGS